MLERYLLRADTRVVIYSTQIKITQNYGNTSGMGFRWAYISGVTLLLWSVLRSHGAWGSNSQPICSFSGCEISVTLVDVRRLKSVVLHILHASKF